MCDDTRSSTTSTSGFSRSAARAATTESSAPPRISRWLTSACLLSCTRRICRSSVITYSARWRLTRSTSAEMQRRLAAGARAGDEHEALRLGGQRLDFARQAELFGGRRPRRDHPQQHAGTAMIDERGAADAADVVELGDPFRRLRRGRSIRGRSPARSRESRSRRRRATAALRSRGSAGRPRRESTAANPTSGTAPSRRAPRRCATADRCRASHGVPTSRRARRHFDAHRARHRQNDAGLDRAVLAVQAARVRAARPVQGVRPGSTRSRRLRRCRRGRNLGAVGVSRAGVATARALSNRRELIDAGDRFDL